MRVSRLAALASGIAASVRPSPSPSGALIVPAPTASTTGAAGAGAGMGWLLIVGGLVFIFVVVLAAFAAHRRSARR